jgi:diacylglycerol kinase family enzyme
VSERPVTIIVNEGSGSAMARLGELEDAVSRAELEARVVRVQGAQMLDQANKAAAAGGVLVAAGGDGTVSSVASVALGRDITFGVIPLGTLNHFARDCGIPLDIDKAVAVVAAGKTRSIPVGDVNGRPFVNNASLGLYPRLVWERQMEQRRGHGKWTAFAIALVRTWQRYPTVTVRVAADGAAFVRHTPFVFIGNGEYEAEGLALGTRRSLDSGTLSIYLAPGVGRFEMLALPFRALAGRLGEDVKFESLTASDVTIETAHHRIAVAIDGELTTAGSTLRFAVHPRTLRVLVSQDA